MDVNGFNLSGIFLQGASPAILIVKIFHRSTQKSQDRCLIRRFSSQSLPSPSSLFRLYKVIPIFPQCQLMCKNVQLSTPQAMIDFILLKFSVIGL